MNGVDRIAAERKRQIEKEGFNVSDDHEHYSGRMSELLLAAECYIWAARQRAAGYTPEVLLDGHPHPGWPWDPDWWKPADDPVRNLEKAGALIAAEIDRMLFARGET